MSRRTERIRDYATPNSGPDNWKGEANSMANIDRWSARASANSINASNVGKYRASNGEMVLPNTAEAPTRTTKKPAFSSKEMDREVEGKDKGDLNHDPRSRYMSKVRREA
jgi:hypothetical protein